MLTIKQHIAYIGALIEHHPTYAEKRFTLTYIDGQFYIQTRGINVRSPGDICQFDYTDMNEGLTSNKWAYIKRKVAEIIQKRERSLRKNENPERTKNLIE